MDKTIGKAWIRELESGRYRKGNGVLHELDGKEVDETRDRMCCLGVLCRMAVTAGVEVNVRVLKEGTRWKHKVVEYGGESGLLPKEVSDWAGMSSTNGKLETNSHADNLGAINDQAETFWPVIRIIRNEMANL